MMRWPGTVDALLLGSPGSGSEILAHPGAHQLGSKTGLPGMSMEKQRRKGMLEGERRASMAASVAQGLSIDAGPRAIHAAAGIDG